MKKITLILLLFGFTIFSSAQCLDATNGQYPFSGGTNVPFSTQVCDGLTVNTISTACYASEYSTVLVTTGETYTFSSSIATDVVTISADGGATAAAFGIGSVTWVSTVTGEIQFYTNLDDGACGASTAFRTRSFVCGTPPTCIYPTAIVFSNITTTTATVSWTASTTVPTNGYEYYYSTSSTAPTAATTPSGNVLAGVTTVNLIGLTAGTNYYVWVRSVCSSSDSSSWSSVANLQTVCTTVTDFSENFDAAVAFPVCWARVGTGGNTNVQASTGSPSSPNVLYIYGTSATSQGLVSMPPVSNAGDGTHRLRFKARANFTVGGIVEVGYLTNPLDATTFVGVQSFTTTSTTVYDSFVATLGTSPGSNQTLAFRHTGTPPNSILIDNVIWETIPTCIEPTALTSSNISSSTATISWTAATTVPANGYDYFISTSNTTPTDTTTPTGNVLAGITTANLTGLNSGTNYYVWVRSVCSNTDKSTWSSVLNLQTLCTAVSDFSENFDAAVAFPACWARVGTGGNTNIQASTGSPSSPNVLYIYGTSATSQGLVSMPLVSNAGDGTHRLRFKARANFTVGGNVEVGYLTDPLDATTFVGVQTFTTTSITVYDSFVATLGTAPSTNQTLAFRHTGTPANSILIDDVVWETIPTCLEPTALSSSNITLTGATISWTAPTSTVSNGYDYYVSSSNTSPTANTIPTGSIANGLSAVLTGLLSSTNYYFWVRSKCSNTNFSIWSNLGSFSTLCAPSTVPYTQDFESVTVPSLPNCTSNENVGTGNNWTTVSNPGSGFTSKALVYKYNSTNAANTWFYTNAISLNAGTSYTISYKYGNNVTNYTENLKVAYGNAANSTQMTINLADHPGITGGTLTTNSVDFTPTTSGTYYFGFNCYSDANQYYLYVDDISLVVTPLATSNFDVSKVNYYPNPVKDILNINFNKSISQISIYNIFGQEVNVKSINVDNSKIDISNLSNGTYLVKVTAEGMIKTIKIIKE